MRILTSSTLLPLITLGFAVGSALAGDDDRALFDKVSEWERAALNREVAALMSEIRAEEFLTHAQQFREKEYRSEKERKSNLNRAGDQEINSGNLQGRVSGNFDRAAADWEKVAAKYKKSGKEEKRHHAKAMAEAAYYQASLACRHAAIAYELAAESFADGNADQLDKAIAASEKAATQREKLAGRK